MRRFIPAFAAILFFACGSSAQSKDAVDRCKGLDERVLSLISEYKELRDKRGRLPQGTFDKDIHASGGRLSRVLSSLGAELGHPPRTRELIVECLGEPDAIRNGRQMSQFLEIYNRELRKAGRKVEEKPDREYLIYFWRGWHDFIFFINEGGVIVDYGWWFAYE